MPKLNTVQTNFTAGEWSPRLHARTDLPGYNNAAKTLENVFIVPQGGARRRDGLRWVASTKDHAKKARVVPFIFSETDAYMLEVGDQYIHFFKDGAQLGAPYEIATTITEAMLFEIDFVQGADTMILTHQDIEVARLRRFADTNWVFDAAPFDPMPFDEIGHSFSATLTLSAATVGIGRTVTASSGIFLSGDVGRQIVYEGGVLLITAFTDASHVTGEITSAFGSVNVPADVWTLDGSPQETVTPSAKDPVEGAVTLTSAPLDAWRAADVGKHVRINGGIVKVTGFTDAKNVTGTIKQVLLATTAAPKGAWSLEADIWSAGNGYPRAVTLYQQRLCLGGSRAYPQTLWGSSIGAYFDFFLGSADADAFGYTLASDQINPIMHMCSGKVLIPLTYGGEFTVKGGIEKPITPTNVQVENQAAYGSMNIRPVRANKDFLYVDQTNTQLLAFVYDASDEDYDAADLTLFAEHVSDEGFVDLSYQRKKDPIVYAPREDGQCPTCTYSAKHEVVAWARQVTDGVIESVATIPYGKQHQTWCVVRRTINGATVRYIERFDPDVLVDSAVTGTSGPGTATITGGDHLEGKEVDCVADGRYMGRFTITGGEFTLPRIAFAWSYGLPYEHTIDPLTPEVQVGDGTVQGNAMSQHEVVLDFLESYHAEVNGDEVIFRKLGPLLLDQPLTPFTGKKRVGDLGWQLGEMPCRITSAIPLPFHLRAIIRKWSTNSG
jgi:hypothetical protein